MTPVVYAAVEGDLDEAIARRLITHVGATPGAVYGKKGKGYLREKIAAFNEAARMAPWLVLVDLNGEHPCAPTLRATWLPHPQRFMCFRIAVKEVESWLLADRDRLAAFLGVSPTRVPTSPDDCDDPKQLMIELARGSKRRDIREDMVPPLGTGRAIGRAYVARLTEFIEQRWRPEDAAAASDSLRRCIQGLRRIVAL